MHRRTKHLYRLVGGPLIALQLACGLEPSEPDPIPSAQCTVRTPYTFGSNAGGELTNSDCVLIDGSYMDFYATTVPAAGMYVFDMSTAGPPAKIALYEADGFMLGFHSDLGQSSDTAIKILLPAGNFILGAGSFPGSTTSYTLTSASGTPDIMNCEVVFVTMGTSTSQNIQPGDCIGDRSPADDFYIYLKAGQPLKVTMRSSVFDSYVELYHDNIFVVAANDNLSTTSNDAEFTFTPSVSGLFFIRAGAAVWSSSGAYTLTIQ